MTNYFISNEGARMTRNATRKLNEVAEAFENDFEGARDTIMRVAQIQAKMSQCIDECLAEFRALFPTPEQQQLNPTDLYDSLSARFQEDTSLTKEHRQPLHPKR